MTPLQHARLEAEIRLHAPSPRVWTTLTERIDAWWCAPIRSTDAQAVQLDLRVGGMLFEDLGSGSGLARGTVVEVRRGERVAFDGVFGLPGALSGTVSWTVSESEGDRSFAVEQLALGEFEEDHLADQRQAWRTLLAAFRRQVDGTISLPSLGS
ncbi:MAG: SRPBCC domain-containing protein [Actinomycetota bacterium]